MRPDLEDAKDFLVLEHGDLRFLIDRETFFASSYLEKSDAAVVSDSQSILPEYLGRTMRYSTETLLIFELDSYLERLFGRRDPSALKIALIAAADSFSAENRELFHAVAGTIAGDVCIDYIAFRVGSLAEIKRIPLRELNLVPPPTRPLLFREGVLGCRFGEGVSADFLIDVESLACNYLARTWKKGGGV